MMTGPSGRDTEGYGGGGSPDSPDRNHQHNIVDEHNHGHQGQHVTGTELHPHPHRQQSQSQRRASSRRASVVSPINYDVPDDYANLEASNVSPVQNPDEEPITRHETLDQVRSRDRDYLREQKQQRRESQPLSQPQAAAEPSEDYDREKGQQQAGIVTKKQQNVSRLATELYTISYLIFFSFLGTLARLGLQALTSNYPQSPIIFPSIWPNFAGCVVMGFLAEDRMLFRSDWGQEPTLKKDDDMETEVVDPNSTAAKKAHLALKKSIPLYIGLATGFCGSFTSFSSFIRDIFLALSNDLSYPNGFSSVASRNGGYSFMALLSVMITTISLSLSGLFLGAHLAIAVAPLFVKTGLTLPYTFVSRVLDRLIVLLGFGCWLGAVFLSIWPPDRHSSQEERWRGTATFALVFAPLGCLLRFYASAHLNGRIPSFPLGTFVVNMLGTAVLGMAWDLEHVPLGGVIGCQVLQGVADGFCGCLTTVSTWAAELAALRRRNAYVYGGMSVGGGLALLVVIMGSLRWTEGFGEVRCVH